MSRLSIALLALLGTLAPVADAQQKPAPGAAKKLYCWNENGRKVCGDALPASAVDNARVEINSRSGLATSRLDRAPTAVERAQAEVQAQSDAATAAAAAAEHRRLMAMVETFATEADLRRAFDNRVMLSRDSVKSAEMGIAGLRESLIGLLRRAGQNELDSKPVPQKLATDIQTQHAQLLKQQRVLAQLRRDQETVRAQLDEAVARYRELKTPATAAAQPTG